MPFDGLAPPTLNHNTVGFEMSYTAILLGDSSTCQYGPCWVDLIVKPLPLKSHGISSWKSKTFWDKISTCHWDWSAIPPYCRQLFCYEYTLHGQGISIVRLADDLQALSLLDVPVPRKTVVDEDGEGNDTLQIAFGKVRDMMLENALDLVKSTGLR
ncbi:hypothetical protein N7451_006474 [Penicillium sp. IBT 35674x]|nr:hypothetical protein N7451_006474 [Penicillium sp. IBT 35674x]